MHTFCRKVKQAIHERVKYSIDTHLYRKVNQEKIMIGHSRQFQNHPSAAHFPLNEMSFEFTDLAKKTKPHCLTLNTYKRCAFKYSYFL